MLFNLVVVAIVAVVFVPTLIPTTMLMGNSTEDLFTLLRNGLRCCLLGKDPLDEGTCVSAPLSTLCYLALSGAYNILVILIIASGSAALVALSSTAILPLSNIAMAVPAIMGVHACSLSVFDVSSSLLGEVILSGTCCRALVWRVIFLCE